jgi:hypothetical protein
LSLPFLASFLAVALCLAPVRPGAAREPDGARRDLAALLESSRPLRIGVVGDSVAGDLARGLQKLLREQSKVTLVKFTKPATGLMRDDVYDWDDSLKSFLRQKKLDVIAVMIGGNDRQSIWQNGTRLAHGTKEWQAEYERRVARFMRILVSEKAKVYWIGLPAVRSDKMAQDYRALNHIYQAQAKHFGFTFVGTWDAFVDAKGRYSSFGHSIEGVKRRLRKNDGIHFTVDGELRLAHLVGRAIARDLGAGESAN